MIVYQLDLIPNVAQQNIYMYFETSYERLYIQTIIRPPFIHTVLLSQLWPRDHCQGLELRAGMGPGHSLQRRGDRQPGQDECRKSNPVLLGGPIPIIIISYIHQVDPNNNLHVHGACPRYASVRDLVGSLFTSRFEII